ncbi:hypothetical protein NL676_035734 [Syzygium grande]|nr:hypothetical protein NL676_035734 [Syzygium grande]
MERLQRMFAGAGGALGRPPRDSPTTLDSAEQVYISSLALLKMLKHGKSLSSSSPAAVARFRQLDVKKGESVRVSWPVLSAGLHFQCRGIGGKDRVFGIEFGRFRMEYWLWARWWLDSVFAFSKRRPGFDRPGRAGVPMEVMGLMLGELVDEYTVRVVDVFAMPQSGTGVSVEAVDHGFQTDMLDMLKQTGRPEMVVGWYHSHPGFGCWLSGVDINTQQSFEALNQRAVAVAVDPIQSIKGKW